MVNEGGHFPEVCKKSFQAMASDLQGAVRREWIEQATLPQLRAMSSRELEMAGRLSEPLYLAPGARSYQVVSWDQALNAIAQKMSAAGPQRSFSMPVVEHRMRPDSCFRRWREFSARIMSITARITVIRPAGLAWEWHWEREQGLFDWKIWTIQICIC